MLHFCYQPGKQGAISGYESLNIFLETVLKSVSLNKWRLHFRCPATHIPDISSSFAEQHTDELQP